MPFSRFAILGYILAAVLLLLPAAPAAARETVTLRLKHVHQFQFAGYYAAIAQGYYREAGLEVTLLEGLRRQGQE